MDVLTINGFFFIAALLIAASVLISPLSSKMGVPLLVLFLGVGMLAGENGPGGIHFDDYTVTYFVSNLALAIILLDGGLRTNVSSFRVALWPSLSLSTLGVLITSSLTGFFAALLFDLSWYQGLLVGAIVGSTDASAVFSLLKGKRINQRVGATLEIESGTNDPMAMFLTIALIGILVTPENQLTAQYLMTNFLQQFGIGILVGLVGGWLLWRVINFFLLPEGLYSILTVSGGLIIFSFTNLLGGSGILAIYTVGILLGNKPTRSKHTILTVLDGMTWLSQIGMFIVLGLLVTPSELFPITIPALILALLMILISRPIAVWVCLLPFRSFSSREKWFLSWVGLRGAVPIILAVFPMLAGVPNATLFFNLAFFVVMVSLILQGGTLAKATRMAKIELPAIPEPYSRSELELYAFSDWQMFIYQLKKDRWYIGSPLRNLMMPNQTRIAGVFRDKTLLHPSGRTQLAVGDIICVIGKETDLDALSHLFSEAPDKQKVARYFGDFFLDINTNVSDVSTLYGLALHDVDESLTLKELVRKELGASPVLGDSFTWQGIDWVVADMQDWQVTLVGLRLPLLTK